jgi:hypothetical protein
MAAPAGSGAHRQGSRRRAEIEALVGGVEVRARDENQFALADGGVAMIIQGGAYSCDAVRAPPTRTGRHR